MDTGKRAMTPLGAVCFCVLMDHHGRGVENAHPDYIEEKLAVMSAASDETCFAMLDASNQDRVLQWAREWKQNLPEWMLQAEKVREYYNTPGNPTSFSEWEAQHGSKLREALSEAWQLGANHERPSFETLGQWRELINEHKQQRKETTE